MNENKLKEIIRDLWICVGEDKFATYLYERRGKEAKEINEYISLIKDIYFNKN